MEIHCLARRRNSMKIGHIMEGRYLGYAKARRRKSSGKRLQMFARGHRHVAKHGSFLEAASFRSRRSKPHFVKTTLPHTPCNSSTSCCLSTRPANRSGSNRKSIVRNNSGCRVPGFGDLLAYAGRIFDYAKLSSSLKVNRSS